MKKIYKVSLAAMTLLTLVACGPKRRPRTQPSTAQSEVTDGKSSKKASSGHEYYQTVLERYQAYTRAIEAGDSAGLETKLKEIDPQSDEYVYAMYLQTLGSKPNLSYFYTDLDKDGRDELLIGNGQNSLSNLLSERPATRIAAIQLLWLPLVALVQVFKFF